MAKFTTSGPIDFLNFDVADLGTGTLANQTTTAFERLDGANDFEDFFGTGFKFSATDLTAGTITHITSTEAGATWDLSAFSMTAAAFNAAKGNAQTFLAAVFAGNDSITGSAAADTLLGFNGNDTIAGLGGLDSLQGGLGNDTYIVDNAGVTVTEASAAGTDLVMSSVDFVLGLNVENLTLTGNGNIDGTGNALANVILGNSGDNSLAGGDLNDTLTGNDGADTMQGDAGADRMTGGAGNDLYIVADKTDVVTESLAGLAGGTDTVRSSITYTLGANVENLVLQGAAVPTDGTGNTLDNSLTGDALANKLSGLAGADNLVGNAGNDTLDGGTNTALAGDTMAGGDGDDLYIQDSALDQITETGANTGLGDELKTNQNALLHAALANIEHYTFTGTTAVTFEGSAANNRITGSAAADSLQGDNGADTLNGLAGNDTLNAGDGDDSMDGGAGADNMHGGTGDDTYVVDNAGDIVSDTGGAGDTNDTVRASITVAVASYNGIENITLTGTGAINATGDGGDNILIGNSGNNKLDDGLGGDDTMDGAKGNDTYIVSNSDDQVSEDTVLGGGVDTVFSSKTFALTTNIENLTLTGTGDIDATGNALKNALVGNEANNDIVGGADTDTLTGNGGADTLDGGTGADKMSGGAGADLYVVDDLKDTVTESITNDKGGGTDLVRSSVTFTLGTNLDDLELKGAVVPTDGTGNAIVNHITGDDLANKLSGLAGNDILIGNDGKDTLDGGTGQDTLTGGEGDDLYIQDDAGDVINADTGSSAGDELRTNQSTLHAAIAGIEHYTFTGSAPVTFAGDGASNKITGTAGNDTLKGEDIAFGGNDTLIGGAGADSLSGFDGSDTYVVDNVGDKVVELFDDDSSGDDDRVISSVTFALGFGLEHLDLVGTAAINGTGTERNNQISGNAAANKLLGLGGSDTLIGGAGNDTLDGGAGPDSMDGGLGNDTYFVDDAGDLVTEADKGGTDTIFSSVSLFLTATPAIENLTLTGTDDLFAYGNLLKNLIVGNDGDNELDGDIDGGDTMIGGAGNDTYNVHLGDVVKELLAGPAGGTDVVMWADDAAYTLGTNIENLILVGRGTGIGNALDNVMTAMIEANKLSGMGGNDSLSGAAGNDTLDGGTGKDTMIGLDGNDVYVVDDAGDIVTENEFEGIDEVRTSIKLTEPFANVEYYTFTGKTAVTFLAGFGDNKLTGTAGNDSLAGDQEDSGGFNDTLIGGAGADTLLGWLGDDTYVIDNVKDVIIDFGGWDRVISSVSFELGENSPLSEGLEELVLTGSAALTGTGSENQAFGDLIVGNAGANRLFGLSGNDTLLGGDGNANDTLDGGFNVDQLEGGGGNDVYIVDNPSDSISELSNGGTDTVFSSASSFSLPSYVEYLTLTGTDDIDGFGGLVVTGNDGNNELRGAKMIGGGGDDVYWVDPGAIVVESKVGATGGIDTVVAGGNYTLGANVENLIVGGNGTGNVLNNRIDGTGGGTNQFDGGVGDDTIFGGRGDDTINTSIGNDRVLWGFEFDSGDGHDLIVGFDGNPVGGQDVFDLDAIFDNWAVATSDRAAFVTVFDNGSTVDIQVSVTDTWIAATLQTSDDIAIGEDISLGTM